MNKNEKLETKEIVSVKNLDSGLTKFLMKSGRLTYVVEIEKNACYCSIEIYRYFKNKKYSKYDPQANSKFLISVKNDVVIDKRFIEDIDNYIECQKLMIRYNIFV